MAINKKQKLAVLVITTLVLIFLVCLPATAANFTSWISMSSGATNDLYGIWGPSGKGVFAVGTSGTILQYDGSGWNAITSGSTSDLHGIWGANSKDVFAVGNSGTVLRYDGSVWNSSASGSASDLYGVWGTTGKDVFAVGSAGTIIHFNGSTWTSMNSGTTKDLQSVWGDGSEVFAAGKSGTILRYDGLAWSSMSSGATVDLNGIWGTSATEVFAAGKSGTILRYNGSTWRSLRSGTTGDLYGIWGTTSKDVSVVGQSGTIAHYDGSTWSSMNRNTLSELRSVWGFSASDIFAVGGAGVILRYLPPTITSISPVQGDQGAVLDVNILGTNLAGASEVQLGSGVALNKITNLNSNQVTANVTIVAGSAAGTRDVTVTTAGGSFVLPASFTVKQALPTLTSVSPDQERQGATLKVTLTGTNLNGASEVRLGAGIAVNSFSVLSANQLAVNINLAADAAMGTRDVSVVTPAGSFTLPISFTIKQALPTLTSVSPDRGNQETTLDVTLAGTNLTGATEVRFGTGIVVNTFKVLSSNQLTANIGLDAGSAIGARDVSITTPGGSYTLPNGFTLKQALPQIISISPNTGSQGATLSVNITGLNFSGASELRLGTGIAVNSFSVVSAKQLTANITIVAGAAIGASDVSITTPGGSFTLPNGFTVKQALPVISSISPNQASQDSVLVIVISGSNFDGASSVSFGPGATIESFTNLSPTQIKITVKFEANSAAGLRDVTVTTPGGSSTLGNSFSVQEKSAGIIILVLIWVGVAVIIALFVIVLSLLRQKRAAKLETPKPK